MQPRDWAALTRQALTVLVNAHSAAHLTLNSSHERERIVSPIMGESMMFPTLVRRLSPPRAIASRASRERAMQASRRVREMWASKTSGSKRMSPCSMPTWQSLSPTFRTAAVAVTVPLTSIPDSALRA
eukprot:scaffold93610_cov25-Tisochrysis_lutea.AAC.1